MTETMLVLTGCAWERKYRVGILLLAMASVAGALRAQVASATLLGEVRDESSAVAPAVTVTARHDTTGFVRTVVTDSLGAYRIGELLPGEYTVTAEKSGFHALEVKGVSIEVNQKARLDMVLKLGEKRDIVAVDAQVSPVQSDDATEGYRLDSSQINALPLADRNVVYLVTLGPGAIPRQLSGFTSDQINAVQANRGLTALNAPINGARSYMNAFLLDAANDTDRNTFAIAVEPPMESVQEFRMQTSGSSAEFSQAAGGVMDVVTKAGTLAWHGSAFDYIINDALDAESYFDNPQLPRPLFHQNQFGGSLGGRVPKLDKTFFFLAYEGLRGQSSAPAQALVPDATIRTGNLAGRSPIYNPFSLDASGNRVPFPDNVIPSYLIDPIASKFLSTYEPLPNVNNPNDNYLDSTPSQNSHETFSGRLDHEFRDQSRFFARYTLNNENNVLAGNFPELPDNESLRAQQAAIGFTRSSATWINEAGLSFTRLKVFDTPQAAFNQDLAGQLGLPAASGGNPANFGLPYFQIEDFSTVTDAPNLPQLQRDNQWQLTDGFSFTRGRHTLKTGFQWMHAGVNYEQSNLSRGEYIFTGAFTASNPNNTASTGDPFADFLLSLPQDTSRTVGTAQGYLRNSTYAAYFQDDWRVAPGFTLNLGVRYEFFGPFSDARNQLLNLDYSTLPNQPQLVTVPTASTPNYLNFAPRAGLAWTPPMSLWQGRKMVFRAAYGIYYSPGIATEAYNLVLNNILTQNNATSGVNPLLTIENGFPQTPSTGFATLYGLDRHAPTPYVQQWNAGIQQELPAKILFEVAYVGSKGTDLGLYRRFNTPAQVETGADLPPRPGDLQSLRTWPGLGPIIQVQHIANSNFNSLQLKATKSLGKGLSFLTSFVWSKSLDDADLPIAGLFDAAGAQDERNLHLEYGPSFFNVPRRFSAGYTYNLPSVSGFLRPVVRNWLTSGIVTLQDGTPENPFYFSEDFANSGTPNRPNIVPGQGITLPAAERTASEYFNVNAFSQPAPYTFGDAGRDILPTPGNVVFDLSLARRFYIREAQTIEFRSEFLNAFNHPNFGTPGPYPDFGPFFGQILTTGQPRRIQLALRFEF